MKAMLLLFTIFSFLAMNNSLMAGTETKDAESYLKNSKTFFIENKGQIKDTKGNVRHDIKYYIKGKGMDIYFRDEGISYVLYKKKDLSNGRVLTNSHRIDLKFEKNEKKYQLNAEDENLTKINFQKSDLNISNIPTYNKVVYQDVYDGIDLAYYTQGTSIKYDIIVRPGANPKDINLIYEGQDGIEKLNDKEIVLNTSLGQYKENIPLSYQLIDNGISEVNTDFQISQNNISFDVDEYDKSKTLIIDPLLEWTLYIGDDRDEIVGRYPNTLYFNLLSPTTLNFAGGGVISDDDGNVYITGSTNSEYFPWTTGSSNSTTDYDIFLDKYNASGIKSYSVYIGSTENDFATGITLDPSDNPIIVGATNSPFIFTTFGLDSYDNSQTNGEYDIYLFKYISGSTNLARCINGTDNDYGRSIDIGISNNIFIIGDTESNDFETKDCFDCSLNGNSDVIVTVVNSSFQTVWSSYFGGDGDEIGMGIDYANSEVAICGATNSESNFPNINQACLPGGGYVYDELNNTTASDPNKMDGFVARIGASYPYNSIDFCTYVGGEDDDYVTDVISVGNTPVIIDSVCQDENVGFNHLMIVGFTKSTDILNYAPNPGPYPRAYDNGGTNDKGDGFIATTVQFGFDFKGFHGGSDEDIITDIALKSDGVTTVYTGYTNSDDFYILHTDQAELNQDKTITKYDAFMVSGRTDYTIKSSSFNGSTLDDYGIGAAFFEDDDSFLMAGETMATDYTGYKMREIINTPALNRNAFISKYLSHEDNDNTLFPTYFGGGLDDNITNVTQDIMGNIYITGWTESDESVYDFPVTTGVHDNTYNGNEEVFVAKFNDLGFLQWSTYIGDYYDEAGVDIAVSGGLEVNSTKIYVVGYAESTTLGTGSSAEYTTAPGTFADKDGFLLKLSGDGSTLEAFTYIGSENHDEATGIDITDDAVYVSGFMSMSDNPMLTTTPGCNSPYNTIDNKWNYNSIYCNEDNISSSTRDGETVGFVTKWDTDLELIWGDWIRDQDPYYVKALDVSVLPNRDWVALVGITDGGDYIFPSLWTEAYYADAQNKNNYSNGDIDGWVMVIKDHDSTRFAEWGNLIEGKNGLNYDADDIVNNVEWLTHSASANDLIIAGHSDTDDEDFDQFSSTKVDNNSGGGNNDIFMQKFDYIDTTFWGTSKVAFYGNGQDDQLYDMYYNSYYDSLALVGKTKSFNPTFPNFTDFTEDAVSFDRVNDNISYYHGVVFMTDNDVDLEWGSFFGDDVVGSPHPHLLPYVFTPDPQDFTATGVIIQSNSEVLFTGNTTIDTLIWKEDVFQEFNAGMIDGMIVRLNENGQTLSKQVNQYYTNEIENILDISIFPNPTKFDLNIEYNSDIRVNGIKLYNSVGKLIYQFYNKIDKIDVSNLPTGVYHIQFDFINSKQNYSFIKQ